MHLDISRNSFDPARHFLRVLQQQGRPLLDADGNEQTAILVHWLQTLTQDLFGHHWGPAPEPGFKITYKDKKLLIGSGRYYVGGLLCVNESEVEYLNQSDLPLKRNVPLPEFPFLVYLDVWERHLTELEDPAVKDPALEQLDATTRTKVVWQVRILAREDLPKEGDLMVLADKLKKPDHVRANDQDPGPIQAFRELLRLQPTTGTLRAEPVEVSSLTPEMDTGSVCISEPEDQYRGMENQLYRVEVHRSGRAYVPDPTKKGQKPTKAHATFVTVQPDGRSFGAMRF